MDPKIWTDMFALAVPVLEKIIRPVIVYIALILGLRLAGKRELAQLNPFDLVVLLTLSNTVQNAIIGDDNSITGGIIGAATLLIMNYLVVRVVSFYPKIDKVIEGSEDVLIEHGVVKMDKLKREIISLTELEIAAHKQGFDSLDEIERAVLEPGGGFSFLARKPRSEEEHYQALMKQMEIITLELQSLRSELRPPAPAK